MPHLFYQLRAGTCWLTLAALLLGLSACGKKYTAANFVGKWQSSRLTTPVHVHANGAWEIKSDEGAVLQYGVWQIKGSEFIWTVQVDSRVIHDGDPIVSSAAREFKVRENDGSVTTFTKLD